MSDRRFRSSGENKTQPLQMVGCLAGLCTTRSMRLGAIPARQTQLPLMGHWCWLLRLSHTVLKILVQCFSHKSQMLHSLSILIVVGCSIAPPALAKQRPIGENSAQLAPVNSIGLFYEMSAEPELALLDRSYLWR